MAKFRALMIACTPKRRPENLHGHARDVRRLSRDCMGVLHDK